MPEFSKNITVEEAKERVTNYIELSKEQLEVWGKIKPVLASLNGKQINKRIAAKIQESLPGYTVHYTKGYSCFEVKIWKHGTRLDYNNHLYLRLGVIRDNTGFSMENFLENHQWLANLEEKIQRYTIGLEHVGKWHRRMRVIKAQEAILENTMADFGLPYIFSR